ncbi:MAG TPA: ethanolamine ammonia-lyase light chain EutC [Myxococcota bacterium]|nr:ethanolamine ammonia-lyase light chain EutC [Myxococcota bacterium]
MTDDDRKCIPNVRARGLPLDEAAAAILEVCERILTAETSGTGLAL